MPFPEDFLHYLWKFRLFDWKDLKTISGDTIEIINKGIHNKDAGPDFEHAHIRIGETIWVGNAEIHLNSSDWDKHQHSGDKAYDNVILHVVFQYDKTVFRSDGSEIQTLELKHRIPSGIQARYEELMQNMNWIPCEKQIGRIDEFHIKNWLPRVLVERLEERAQTVNAILEEYKGSWDDAFYVMLARNFGFKINTLPFEMMARSLPQQILARHKQNALQIEALIFGQSGFLNDKLSDSYAKVLQAEYKYLRNKYRLKSLDKFLWKFLRLRPQNFPTIRLAQFAALVIKSNHLFSRIIETGSIPALKELFTDLPVNDYWKTHFRFDKETGPISAQIGEDAVNTILLNTVSLFLYSYGKYTGNGYYISRSLALLESLPSEINQITRRFTEIGINSDKADSSQALLQLKKYYCDEKKCLNCGIGIQLINY
ncbi:MAG TPA: DUF2851 domain-containing protein [Sphingobacteriaceae bacterium]|nr:DUF2851 domain-containing protein [Sphingobacteriaceae bacterium]